MATKDHLGGVPGNPIRLKGFDRKDSQPTDAAQAPAPPAAPSEPAVSAPRLNFPAPQAAAPAPAVEPVVSKPADEERIPVEAAPQPTAPRVSGAFQSARKEVEDDPQQNTAYKSDTAAASAEASSSRATFSFQPSARDLQDRRQNRAYQSDADPERVRRRQWWKYDLYVRSGRKKADEEAGSRGA